ncbi:MAG: 3-dehydroquinate synthase [Altibacter sp.]|uniref:3-dehydroquinate synthase n=1 Tax=Altibacter sp. TaxID=2024823 RepID=UPI001D8A59F1|nr:3-dehydroquinate synthase [Altibacter sp.]MBZ0326233.1 3-dehydroquinate synthase [Altibacter sp.]
MNTNTENRGAVYCNEDVWSIFESNLQALQPSSIFVLTDTNTEKLCLPYFLGKIQPTIQWEVLQIPVGESHKNITTCLQLWSALSEKGADRKSLLINLGGGVVTDLGGFVACTFKRGIEFINIPTSLLAMVDASVGGKNGVDLGHIKNQVGLIKDPYSVLIDTHFLLTLPEEEVISGFAEMLKHGLISSEDYWNRVALFDVSKTTEAAKLIWESVEIKQKVVAEDPFEKGHRKTLNYGHTLGHAIESHCLTSAEKKALLHGEAIAIGMILATYISSEMIGFPKEKLDQIARTILKHFEKISFAKNEIDAIIALLKFDKKNANGKVLFVLLKDIGNCKIDCEVTNDLLYKAFEYYENLKKY